MFTIQEGKLQPMSVAVGETVLLPEWGGTKIEMDEKVVGAVIVVCSLDLYSNIFPKEYFIYKEIEFLGIFKPE